MSKRARSTPAASPDADEEIVNPTEDLHFHELERVKFRRLAKKNGDDVNLLELRMGQSADFGYTREEGDKYDAFITSQIEAIGEKRPLFSRLAARSDAEEEALREVPLETEPPWLVTKTSARNALSLIKIPAALQRLAHVQRFSRLERHMKMALVNWNKGKRSEKPGSPPLHIYPFSDSTPIRGMAEWMEKHQEIDLWRVFYRRYTAAGSDASHSWMFDHFRTLTNGAEVAHVVLVALDFVFTDSADVVVRFCYLFGATDSKTEERLAREQQSQRNKPYYHPCIVREAAFLKAFAPENNTTGLYSNNERLILDRREFYLLCRGSHREVKEGTGTYITIHGPTQFNGTFVGYYYYLINPRQQGADRPKIAGSHDVQETLRTEGLVKNMSLYSIDDPFK